MANEPSIVDNFDKVLNFTVADGTGIEQYTLCKLTDPRTASASDGSGDMIAGLAHSEKIASDGVTSLGMVQEAVIDAYISGSGLIGQQLMSAGHDNYFKVASKGLSGAAICGHLLEAASNGEKAHVYFKIGGSS